MSNYKTGHLKHNTETLEVAVRTTFPEDDERLAQMAWVIASPHYGTKHATTVQVDDWDDLFIPGAGS